MKEVQESSHWEGLAHEVQCACTTLLIAQLLQVSCLLNIEYMMYGQEGYLEGLASIVCILTADHTSGMIRLAQVGLDKVIS